MRISPGAVFVGFVAALCRDRSRACIDVRGAAGRLCAAVPAATTTWHKARLYRSRDNLRVVRVHIDRMVQIVALCLRPPTF